jgi:hypothetical protein
MKMKKRETIVSYLLVLALALGLLFGFGFSVIFTGFIGSPQQTISTGSQPHGSSTKSISPQSSHLYLSPFLFAKNNTCLKILYIILLFSF